MLETEMDAMIEQLKKDLEHLPKAQMEWQVLADIYEDLGCLALATGLRSWTRTYHEPIAWRRDKSTLEYDVRWLSKKDLEQWSRHNVWKVSGSDPETKGVWRWQSEGRWRRDINYVEAPLFDRLEGPFSDGWTIYDTRVEGPFSDGWTIYDTRVAAVLDYAQAVGRR